MLNLLRKGQNFSTGHFPGQKFEGRAIPGHVNFWPGPGRAAEKTWRAGPRPGTGLCIFGSGGVALCGIQISPMPRPSGWWELSNELSYTYVGQAVSEHLKYSLKTSIFGSGGVARGGIEISPMPRPSGWWELSNKVSYTSVNQPGAKDRQTNTLQIIIKI